jgi:hypothetical protein
MPEGLGYHPADLQASWKLYKVLVHLPKIRHFSIFLAWICSRRLSRPVVALELV